jgi:predicted enzyme related to lactoylglutathione lyase
MFQKLRTVIYHVNDIEKAKQWYINITGVQPYFDEPFYVGFDINGCELGLDPDNSGVTGGTQSAVYWAVQNIRGCVSKLVAAGATILSDVQNVGGPIEVALVQDPFGNAVGLIEGAG